MRSPQAATSCHAQHEAFPRWPIWLPAAPSALAPAWSALVRAPLAARPRASLLFRCRVEGDQDEDREEELEEVEDALLRPHSTRCQFSDSGFL
jgi:hypothetical protein